MWTYAEFYVAIIVGSIPACRGLTVKYFDELSESLSRREHSQDNKSPSPSQHGYLLRHLASPGRKPGSQNSRSNLKDPPRSIDMEQNDTGIENRSQSDSIVPLYSKQESNEANGNEKDFVGRGTEQGRTWSG